MFISYSRADRLGIVHSILVIIKGKCHGSMIGNGKMIIIEQVAPLQSYDTNRNGDLTRADRFAPLLLTTIRDTNISEAA